MVKDPFLTGNCSKSSSSTVKPIGRHAAHTSLAARSHAPVRDESRGVQSGGGVRQERVARPMWAGIRRAPDSCPPHTFAHGPLPLRAECGARRRLGRLGVAHFVNEPFADETDPGVAWVS